jgi:hypothetical protein
VIARIRTGENDHPPLYQSDRRRRYATPAPGIAGEADDAVIIPRTGGVPAAFRMGRNLGGSDAHQIGLAGLISTSVNVRISQFETYVRPRGRAGKRREPWSDRRHHYRQARRL